MGVAFDDRCERIHRNHQSPFFGITNDNYRIKRRRTMKVTSELGLSWTCLHCQERQHEPITSRRDLKYETISSLCEVCHEITEIEVPDVDWIE